uniref:Uncharacterized protein n=1 Tax=Triticum urartu TaxID=4572 RepID=A0A8R7TPL0_TRIUA
LVFCPSSCVRRRRCASASTQSPRPPPQLRPRRRLLRPSSIFLTSIPSTSCPLLLQDCSMVLGGCGIGADGARADQFNGGSSTGQQQQHGGRPLDREGPGTANRSGSGNHDANASGSQRSCKGITMLCLFTRCKWNHMILIC